MKCVYWHAELLVYPIGNATLFTAHKLASRRETAVPAFSPPDSPLFQFPVARNVCWYFPSITAPAVNRLHRLTSRLKCSASFARAEFLQRVRRLLTGGSLRPACALGGNRLASLFQDEVLQQPPIFCNLLGKLTDRLPTAVAEEAVIIAACQCRNVDCERMFCKNLLPFNNQFVDFRNKSFTLFCRSLPILHREFAVQLEVFQPGGNEVDTAEFR